MVEIQIKYETRSLFSRRNFIKKTAKSVLAKEKIKNAEGIPTAKPWDAEISILITTDKKMKVLNKKYRNINKPTDILSFPQENSYFLGDIVISAETLKNHARLYENTIDNELKLLITHGIRSLLGKHP